MANVTGTDQFDDTTQTAENEWVRADYWLFVTDRYDGATGIEGVRSASDNLDLLKGMALAYIEQGNQVVIFRPENGRSIRHDGHSWYDDPTSPVKKVSL